MRDSARNLQRRLAAEKRRHAVQRIKRIAEQRQTGQLSPLCESFVAGDDLLCPVSEEKTGAPLLPKQSIILTHELLKMALDYLREKQERESQQRGDGQGDGGEAQEEQAGRQGEETQ